ncbi:MAG TPA: GntR family transcriptional regulator [Amycolatopsis sp.]|nr:GntR family transcriptional regulator [Amycolatopsis sp.]
MHTDSAYGRLARQLREKILRHEFPAGVRLPTEAELADTHRVSRQTVRRAFQDLVAEGMVYRVPGRGTFATSGQEQYLRQFGSIDDLMALSIDTSMRVTSPLRRQIDVDAAGRLRLSSDAVDTLSVVRLHDDTPFCVTTVFLRPAIGALLADSPEVTEPDARSNATVIGLLEGKLADPITEAEQSVTVGTATAETARLLRCEPGHPLLRIDRLYLSSAGEPAELAISHFLPEHYSYRVKLRRQPS